MKTQSMTRFMTTTKRVAKLLPIIAVATFFTLGCSRSNTTPSMNGRAAEVKIPVEGMVCASCVARTKRALKSVAGVEEVEVSLEKHEARVRYDSAQTNSDRLAATIRELGYKPGVPIEVSK